MRGDLKIPLLPDGGTFYRETDINAFIVEPFNMVSAVVFVFIALYWLYKIKGKYQRYFFLTVSAVLLLVGGVGGTLYHGFRSHAVFMLMDWGPILIICIMASAYFVYRMLNHWLGVVLMIFSSVILQVLAFQLLPESVAINVSYALLGLMLLLPLLILLVRTRFQGLKHVAIALAAFSIALVSRILDPFSPFEFGTHFLWHVFGAVACFFMFRYVYLLYKVKLTPLKL